MYIDNFKTDRTQARRPVQSPGRVVRPQDLVGSRPVPQPPNPPPQPVTKRRRRLSRKVLIITSLVLVMLLAGSGSTYLVLRHKSQKKTDSKAAEQRDASEAAKLSTQLSQYIDLPSGTPVLATVKNVSEVASNPFFAKAQTGDILLYYQTAKVAILYRPATGKVINYSPNATISTTPTKKP